MARPRVAGRGRRGALDGDRAKHLVHRVREKLDTVVEDLVRDLVEGDAESLEGLQHLPSRWQVLLEAGADLSVVAKGIHRGQRHCIDRGGADQLLYIEHVAVFGIFRPGAGPQKPLRPSALRAQRLPAWSGEEALVALVSERGVSNRYLAANACQGAVFGVIAGLIDARVEEL